MQKDQYWQKIRGFCIFAVVWIHTSGFSNDLSYQSFDGIYYFITRNLLSFPVAVLFFLAGYYTQKCDDWLGYIKKRLVRIGVPYLTFTMGYIIYQIMLFVRIHDIKGMVAYLFKVPRIILLGEAATPFYYSVVLLLFILVTPVLYVVMDTDFVRVPFIISGFFLVLLYYFQFTEQAIAQFFPLTPIWLSFYYYGIIAKEQRHFVFKKSQLKVLCVISLVFLFTESGLLIRFTSTGAFAYSQMRISAFIFAGMIIQYAIQYHKKDYIQTMICKLGDMSYGIYSIHCFWMQFCWIAYERISFFRVCSLVFVQGIEILISLLMSIITIMILQRLFKQKSKILFGV